MLNIKIFHFSQKQMGLKIYWEPGHWEYLKCVISAGIGCRLKAANPSSPLIRLQHSQL